MMRARRRKTLNTEFKPYISFKFLADTCFIEEIDYIFCGFNGLNPLEMRGENENKLVNHSAPARDLQPFSRALLTPCVGSLRR